MRCRSGSVPGGLTVRPGLRPARACVRLVCALRCSRAVKSDACWIVSQAGSRRFCVNAASVRCAGWPPIWSPSMLRGGFARSRSAGPVRPSRRTARSYVDLAARRRCRTCAPIADDRRANSCRASSRLDRAIGFFSCHRVTELPGCSVAARRFLRFRPSWLVPANVGWLPRFMGCGAGGRCGGRAPDHRFGRFTPSRASADGERWLAARPRFRSAVAIAVSRSRTRARPVSRRGTGVVLLRSISFSTLQAASAVVAARLGSASGMGSVVVGPSAGSFGICPSRVGRPEETALSRWRPPFAIPLAGRSVPVQSARVPVRAGAGFLMSGSLRISIAIGRELPPVSVSDSLTTRAPAPPSLGATASRFGLRLRRWW